MADAGHYSVRDVVGHMSASRGHRLIAGSPQTVATAMRDWVDREGADGYIVMPAVLPDDLHEFIERVVPLLRASGHIDEHPASRPLASRYRTPESAP